MAPSINASVTGSTFLSDATSGLDKKLVTDLGWAKTGSPGAYVYTSPTVNGRTITFTVGTQTAGYVPITCLGQTFYLHTGGTDLAQAYQISIYASTSHVFIVWEGPAGTGQQTANGSSRGFFCATSFTPYLASDVTQANQWCCFGSGRSTTIAAFNAKVYVKVGLDSVANAPAELMTMRPAVQDVVAEGDLPRSRSLSSNLIYWPFVLVEDVGGVRGRLDNVYFGGEAYQLTADSTKPTYAGLSPTIDGYPCYTVMPFFQPFVAGQYSPVGVPLQNTSQASTATDGGPFIAVRSS